MDETGQMASTTPWNSNGLRSPNAWCRQKKGKYLRINRVTEEEDEALRLSGEGDLQQVTGSVAAVSRGVAAVTWPLTSSPWGRHGDATLRGLEGSPRTSGFPCDGTQMSAARGPGPSPGMSAPRPARRLAFRRRRKMQLLLSAEGPLTVRQPVND